MGLSKVGSAEYNAEQSAMRIIMDERWKDTRANRRRARSGGGAVLVGQSGTTKPYRDPDTAAVDTVCNVCHWLGQKGLSPESIADVLRVAASHFETERKQ